MFIFRAMNTKQYQIFVLTFPAPFLKIAVMKKTFTIFAAAVVAVCAGAHEAWNDILQFKINKEAPCAFYTVETSFDTAKNPVDIDGVENVRKTQWYKSLNGDWKFFFAKNHAASRPEFRAPDFDDSDWDTMDVPNSWQCRGYDRIFFNNHTGEFGYDYDGNMYDEFKYGRDAKGNRVLPAAAYKPFIPELHRQIGVYRKKFVLPENWNGKNIFIQFDGVRTGFNVYVNGSFVGYSEDSFTPAKFDITKFVRRGAENTVVAEVYKYTTGAYMEMQDMPHMLGIVRDVNLIARSPLHIEDYYAPAKVADDLKSAEVELEFKLENRASSASEPAKIEAFLFDASGAQVGTDAFAAVDVPAVAANGSVKVCAKRGISDIKLWSPDAPNLYYLVFKLSDSRGAELETIKADFGFKKFGIDAAKRQLILNKKRFFIKGVNHHDWSPDKGKAMDFHWAKKDVMLMKKMNMNAVRTSHYPKDSRFYMLCSRLGILVLDEANHEMHFFRDPVCAADLDIYVPASVDRMLNMVVRDRNVPSVAIFSVGNESAPFYAKSLAEMVKAARPLIAKSGQFIHSEAEVSDIVDKRANGESDFFSPMYGGIPRMEKYLNEYTNETKPFFFCEYFHCKGNALGDFYEGWRLIRSRDSLNGGFLWDMVDQGLYMPRPDDPSKRYISDGRDWNTKPSQGSNSMDGIVFADRTYSAKFDEVRRVYQNIQISAVSGNPLKLVLSNEFISTNANVFTPVVEVQLNGQTVAQKYPEPFDVPAGEKRTVEISLPEYDATKAGDYFYTLKFLRNADTAFAHRGDVVSCAQFKLVGNPLPEASIPAGVPQFVETDAVIAVKTACGSVVFDKTKASLSSYTANGNTIINRPFEFDFFTAQTDHYRSSDRSLERADLLNLSHKNPRISFDTESGFLRVYCKNDYLNKAGNGFCLETVYTVAKNGYVGVSSRFSKVGKVDSSLVFARLGTRFGVDAKYSVAEYLGRGPLANYNNRYVSCDFGLYRTNVADFFENFSRPQDTGNRECVKSFALTDGKSGVLFAMQNTPNSVAALPWTQREMAEAKHPYMLPESVSTEVRITRNVSGLASNPWSSPLPRRECRIDLENPKPWFFTIVPFDTQSQMNDIRAHSISESFLYKF